MSQLANLFKLRITHRATAANELSHVNDTFTVGNNVKGWLKNEEGFKINLQTLIRGLAENSAFDMSGGEIKLNLTAG